MGDRRAYDLLIQCETGLLSVTGSPDAPAKAGISVADIAGGMFAFSSILAALYARERTGDGAALSVSLFESLTEWMSQPMYYAMYTGTPPPRTGTSHATIAPYGTFRTAGGGSVQLAVQNDREWRRLCDQVLGRPGLADDPRFATNVARVANRAELHAEIEAALAACPPEKVLELLDAAQIANGRMNTVARPARPPAARAPLGRGGLAGRPAARAAVADQPRRRRARARRDPGRGRAHGRRPRRARAQLTRRSAGSQMTPGRLMSTADRRREPRNRSE